MSTYDFWTHGISVQAAKTADIRRGGARAIVYQSNNENNWFFFAIPTPTIHDGDDVQHRDVFLKAWVNQGAKVEQVHVWDGNERVARFDHLGYVNRDIDESWNIPDRRASYGLVVCIRVEFLNGNVPGEVHFFGAGARFEA